MFPYAERKIRRLLFRALADPIYGWPAGTRLDRSLPPDPQILVVRTDRIGDAIVSTPLLRELRKRFAASRIDILLGEKNEVVAPLLPYVDDHFVLRKDKWTSTVRELRMRKYALLINTQLKPSVNATLTCRLVSAARILEYPLSAPFTEPPPDSRHIVSMTSQLLGPLGVAAIRDDQREEFPLEVSIPAESAHYAERVRAQLPDEALTQPRVVVNLSAGSMIRRPAKAALMRRVWPIDRIADLAVRLNQAGFTPILCSDPSETHLLEQARERTDDTALALPVAASYADFAGLLTLADIVVSPDTSTTHLAAALGKPTVALFHNERNGLVWGPWGASCTVIASAGGITAIEPSEVFRAVLDLKGHIHSSRALHTG